MVETNIATLAKAVICIPATLTPSKRLFSGAGHIVSKRRTCLNPENVDVILFLNKNFLSTFLHHNKRYKYVNSIDMIFYHQ